MMLWALHHGIYQCWKWRGISVMSKSPSYPHDSSVTEQQQVERQR